MRLIVLLPLLVLAACATKQERCISDATQDLRVVNRLIHETQATIERGYAVGRAPRVRPRLRFCYGGYERGFGAHLCNENVIGSERVARAVDLTAERAKLASLRDKRAVLRRRSQIAVADCRGRYAGQ